ncbi:MAG: flavin reductase family protein [Dialister sp.]|nr:flavin reductase family protein [Dialister sp.]
MKKSFRPQSWLYPQPVLVIASGDADGTPDAMVAAWGGIYDTNQIGFMLAHAHKTTANIRAAGAFTVSMGTVPLMAETDYLGTVSGNDVKNKIAACDLHAVKSEYVNAPVIEEFPLTFECKVSKITAVNEDSHFVGDIVNILADESILTDGRIDPKKLQALTFDSVHRTYVTLGETCGRAWAEGRKFIAPKDSK